MSETLVCMYAVCTCNIQVLEPWDACTNAQKDNGRSNLQLASYMYGYIRIIYMVMQYKLVQIMQYVGIILVFKVSVFVLRLYSDGVKVKMETSEIVQI